MTSSKASLMKKATILFFPMLAYVIAVLCQNEFLSNLFSSLNALTATTVLFIGYLKAEHSAKGGVLLYALGCFSWAAADIFWMILVLLKKNPNQLHFLLFLYSLTNIFFIAAQVFFIFARLKKWDRLQVTIDIVVNGFLNCTIIWLLFFKSNVNILSEFLLSDFTSIICVVIDILIGIGIYTFFLSIRSGKVPTFLKIIFFGVLVFSYVDIIYYYIDFSGFYVPNTLIDVIYAGSLTLIAFGALYRAYLGDYGKEYELLTNIGKRKKWSYLTVYPLLAILLDLIITGKFTLKINDFLLWLFTIILYRILCGILQLSHTKAELLKNALSESERSRTVLMSSLPGMAYRCDYDPNWTMRFVSEGCFKLTGYSPESFLNNKDLAFKDIITLSYRKGIWNEWGHCLEKKLPFKYEYEIITAAGEKKWVLEMGEGIFGETDEVLALEGIILDMSDRKQMEEDLRFYSEHDSWTGLYNLRYLENLLVEDAVKKASEKRAIVCIDLSKVHTLSLLYGFYYSREVIKRLAVKLQTYCDKNYELFNIHEYKFAFYIKNYKDKKQLLAFCDKIGKALESVLIIDRIGAGIGIVEIDEENAYDVDRIFKNFLIASEKANVTDFEQNYACYFYDNETDAEIYREETIRRELALIGSGENSGNLFLRFQPIHDLKENRIIAFEALARIHIADFGLIPPDEFIPIAEKTMLIVPLGQQILLQALAFTRNLKENGFNNVKIAVNISALQLLRSDFSKNLLNMIKSFEVKPSNIEIEITESIFASDFQSMNIILGELQQSGLSIAIDDFGTGYSSFAREHELNINSLKIDKYFIDKLMELNEDDAITGDIISISHKLGHTVTAEGVEHEKQLKYLKEHGCDKIQGYLIGEPLSEDEVLALLKKQLNQNNYTNT